MTEILNENLIHLDETRSSLELAREVSNETLRDSFDHYEGILDAITVPCTEAEILSDLLYEALELQESDEFLHLYDGEIVVCFPSRSTHSL